MNVNLYVIEDYENETTLRPKKNKPKQSQSRNNSMPKDLLSGLEDWWILCYDWAD